MRRSLQLSLFAVVLLGLVGGTLAFFVAQKSVTLTVDGQVRHVGTYADTVGEVLDEEGLRARRARRPPAGRRRRARATATPSSSTAPARCELTVDGVSREVYVTALSVDEALGQLGYRADGLVLSASRSERLPLDGMELTITTPKEIVLVADGQERVVTHDRRDRRRPARRAGHRAERDRPHQPLPGPGAAEPHAAAGLPGAGRPRSSETAAIAARARGDPRPRRLRGRADGHHARRRRRAGHDRTASRSSTASRPAARTLEHRR